MAEFKELMPHGELQEVFPDVFFVTGTTKPSFAGVDWQFSRNMTVVRDGDVLTLVNTVRLDDPGLAKLDSLGKVTNVVKLGAFHGMDDHFYLDRYEAKQWALPGSEHDGGQKTDVELKVGGEMPCVGCSLFVWETSAQPEALLLLEREGGIVIACDSLQNWVEVDQFFDQATGERMSQIGFIKPANVGPGWRQACNPEAPDFKRLKGESFKHLMPAHGVPIKGDAHDQFAATFAREFGV